MQLCLSISTMCTSIVNLEVLREIHAAPLAEIAENPKKSKQTNKSYMAEKALLNPVDREVSLGGLRRGTMKVTVKPSIKPDEVIEALKRIIDIQGCTSCGFQGFDVLIRRQNPVINQFKGLENIADISEFGNRF